MRYNFLYCLCRHLAGSKKIIFIRMSWRRRMKVTLTFTFHCSVQKYSAKPYDTPEVFIHSRIRAKGVKVKARHAITTLYIQKQNLLKEKDDFVNRYLDCFRAIDKFHGQYHMSTTEPGWWHQAGASWQGTARYNCKEKRGWANCLGGQLSVPLRTKRQAENLP